jgi:hypothetical protein
MALDRYQRRGITLERTQPLDFAATREAISFSKDLSARLDKISDIAFEQLKTKAEREGKLYGVQNRPTLEQVQDAIRTKTPRESLEALYEPGDTVFSASARDAQGALLQQDLLHDITLKFQLIDQSIKNEDDIDLDELLVDINANIEGYANVIDQIDPERGIKFRAAASTVGSQTVDAAIKMIDKKNGLIKEQKIQDQLIASKDYITRTVASKLDPLSTKLLITERKENFYELARQRPETMSKNIADFDKAVKESVISEVANDLILSDNLSKFYKGDMGDWDVVLRSEGLDDADSINKIIKLATDRIDQKLTTAKKLRDTARETRHEEFIELYDRYDRKELSGEDFKIALKKLNYPLSKELIKEIDEDKTSSMMQDDVFNDLALRVQVGEMSYDEIDAKAYVGEITHMQGVELKKQWRQVNKTLTQGNNAINNTFKMMDEREVLLLKLDDPRRILIAAARNQLAKEAEIALSKGESFNQTIEGERIAQEVLQGYAKDAMPKQEKYIMNILDKTNMVYNRDAFINMSDEELAKIVTKKGNKLARGNIAQLKKRRDNLRKLNQGLILSAEEF